MFQKENPAESVENWQNNLYVFCALGHYTVLVWIS